MVSQVGLNPIVSQLPTPTGAGNLPVGNPNNGLSPSGNNYTNDVMMGCIDFDKILGTTNQQLPISQNSQTSFGSNPQVQNTSQAEKNVADEQESGGSNIAKIVCASGGFLAPLAGKVVKWLRGANPKTLFKFKQLAVTCPVLGVAGLGIGMLLDACLDAKKAADKEKQRVQNQTSPPTKFNSIA